MAPLPQNNTARVFFDYVTGSSSSSRQHTASVRLLPNYTYVDAQTAFLAVLTALTAGSFRVGWRVTQVRIQMGGMTWSIPVPMEAALAAFVGTGGISPYSPRFEAVEDVFVGRSLESGRRVTFRLYRAQADVDGNFRVVAGTTGMGVMFRDALTVMSTSYGTRGSFAVIDGTAPVWYGYVNQNYNSYWETRSRNT